MFIENDSGIDQIANAMFYRDSNSIWMQFFYINFAFQLTVRRFKQFTQHYMELL